MTKLIKRKSSKICPCCLKRFFRKKDFSNSSWEDQRFCSQSCGHKIYLIDEYKQQRLEYALSNTITTESGCMEWQSHRTKGGYSELKIINKPTLGHRFVWEQLNGTILEGLCVLHSCDNPPCINPEHLFLGTKIDNMKDRDQKGRQAKGYTIGNCKIAGHDKENLLQMAKDGIPYKEMGEILGVSRHLISKICVKNQIRRNKPHRMNKFLSVQKNCGIMLSNQ